MNNFIKNIKFKKYCLFIGLFIFLTLILTSFSVYSAESENDLGENVKENKEIKNPFYDYRKDRDPETNDEKQSQEKSTTTNEKEVKEVIKIKDKRIEPSFYWQGLILSENKYKVLLELNNETHIMDIGDKLNGYQIINIDSNKITLSKDNYIYYLKMGRE